MDDKELELACRLVASHFEGDTAVRFFDYYDAINHHFFNGVLPRAFIFQGITAYGGCQGLTQRYENPVILLHKGVYLKNDQDRFYTLLHEAIHVYILYVLKYEGIKSHDSDEWLTEVNRIAPMLGYEGITMGASRVIRLPKDEGGSTQRVSTGDIPYKKICRFPHGIEEYLKKPLPPFEQWLNVTANNM